MHNLYHLLPCHLLTLLMNSPKWCSQGLLVTGVSIMWPGLRLMGFQSLHVTHKKARPPRTLTSYELCFVPLPPLSFCICLLVLLMFLCACATDTTWLVLSICLRQGFMAVKRHHDGNNTYEAWAGWQFRGLGTCPHGRKQGSVQVDVVLELAKGSTSGSKGSSRREGATRTWFILLLWKGHSYSNQATPNNATPYETIGAIFIKTTTPSFWVSWLDSGLLAHAQMPQPIEPSQWPTSILLFCAVPAPLCFYLNTSPVRCSALGWYFSSDFLTCYNLSTTT